MRTDLQLSHIAVDPGATARIEIEVTNTDDFIDGVSAIADGINPAWVRFERPLVSLFPEATDTIVMLIDVPVLCPAGDYLIDVHIVSAIDDASESVHDFWLTVAPRPQLEIDLRPSIVRGGRKGRTVATLVNTGNSDLVATLTADDPAREVDAAIAVPELVVPFGQRVPVDIEFRGRRPWFGEATTHLVTIRALADGTDAENTVTFSLRPRVARGVITALILLAIVALWALIFLYVINTIRAGGDPAKAVPERIHKGAENIELALIRGTVDGTVRASTSGDGIPGVTVEAFRVKQFPIIPGAPRPEPATTLVSAASGGTGDDGNYTLRTLIPGDYVLRFSAPGYGQQWYPGDLESEVFLPIAPKDPARGHDISLEGALGSVEVQIDVPDGADASQLSARITPKDGALASSATGAMFAQVASDCAVSPDGLVSCSGLSTPAEYLITVSGPGFETQRIDVTLVGGDDTVVDTVQLAGEPGTISGQVFDQQGAALVGARVTVSSGQYVARVFVDRAGVFIVDDLPTPADYVVDISLTGFVGRTVALPLEAGGSAEVARLDLVGGVGTVDGSVVDEAGNPLPGVEIVVAGESSTARTATLTDGGIGTFLIRDLAVPGTYSVAFTAPGYRTETRQVTFTGPGTESVGVVQMFTSFGQIEGSVVDPTGSPVAGADVELLDGLRSRTTTTSTSGAGSFGFSDVAPGAYTLIIRSTADPANVKMWVAQIDIGPGERVQLDRLVLPLQALGTITGAVEDAAGTRLGLATIALVGEGRAESRVSVSSGPGVGTFEFTGLDVPGTYQLTVSAAGYDSQTASVTLSFTGGTFVQAIDIELPAQPGNVSGAVVSRTRDPIAGASVTITDSNGDVQTVLTGEAGVFTFVAVAAGQASISVVFDDENGLTGSLSDVSFLVPPGGGDLSDPLVVPLTRPTATTAPTTVPATTTTTTIATTTTTAVATTTTTMTTEPVPVP